MVISQVRNAHLSGGDVNFEASISDSWVPCRISHEALGDHFGGDAAIDLVAVLLSNETAIVATAKKLYAAAGADEFNAGNRLVLKTTYF